MTTNLHGRIEQLSGRKFFSKKHNAYVGVRYALAEKADVDRQSIIDLEYDGLHSVGPAVAKKIFQGLGAIQGSPIIPPCVLSEHSQMGEIRHRANML